MKVQDLIDDKVIPPTELPDGVRNSTPVMTDVSISKAGLLKLSHIMYKPTHGTAKRRKRTITGISAKAGYSKNQPVC